MTFAKKPRPPSKQKLDEALRLTMREAILTSPNGLWLLLTEVLMHPTLRCDIDKLTPQQRERKRQLRSGCHWKTDTFYEPLHKTWCDWVQQETPRRKGLLAPRGHLKSSVVTLGKATYAILQNPNIRILIVSQREKNATNFLGVLKQAFQRNERMRWLFPEWCVEEGRQFGNQQEFTVPARDDTTLAAPTAYSVHLAASMASQHYDLVIFDDPVSEDDVTTEDQATKSRDNYDKMIPLLDPGGEAIIVGTRYEYMDLYSTLLMPEQGGTATSTPYQWIVRMAFEVSDLPTTPENAEQHFRDGEPIWPSRFSRDVLLDILAEYQSNPSKGEVGFWRQYMNTCRSPGAAPFLDAWFQQIKPELVPPLFGKTITSDTALKDDAKRPGGDFTVMGPGGFDAEGRLYIYPDCYRSNVMKSDEYVRITVMLAKLYQITRVAKQKVSEDSMGTQLESAFKSERMPLTYLPITVAGMGRKTLRIKDALQAPMARGEVFFVMKRNTDGTYSNHPLFEQAKKELINLGQFPVDDTADFMANFYHPEVVVQKRAVSGQQTWRVPGAPPQSTGTQPETWRIGRSRGAGWTN